MFGLAPGLPYALSSVPPPGARARRPSGSSRGAFGRAAFAAVGAWHRAGRIALRTSSPLTVSCFDKL